jgi:hypothetical protein
MFDTDHPPFSSSASSLSTSSLSSPNSPNLSDSDILFKMEENNEASTMPLPIARVRGESSRRVFPAARSSPSPSLPQQFLFTPVERSNFPESLRTARSLDEEGDSLALFMNETREQRSGSAFQPRVSAGSPSEGILEGSGGRVVERKMSMQQIALERFKDMTASFTAGSGVREEGRSVGGGGDEDLLFQMSELDAQ